MYSETSVLNKLQEAFRMMTTLFLHPNPSTMYVRKHFYEMVTR